jgi:hypothetical protein
MVFVVIYLLSTVASFSPIGLHSNISYVHFTRKRASRKGAKPQSSLFYTFAGYYKK